MIPRGISPLNVASSHPVLFFLPLLGPKDKWVPCCFPGDPEQSKLSPRVCSSSQRQIEKTRVRVKTSVCRVLSSDSLHVSLMMFMEEA